MKLTERHDLTSDLSESVELGEDLDVHVAVIDGCVKVRKNSNRRME